MESNLKFPLLILIQKPNFISYTTNESLRWIGIDQEVPDEIELDLNNQSNILQSLKIMVKLSNPKKFINPLTIEKDLQRSFKHLINSSKQ